MKITFLAQTPDGKVHLFEHDTKRMGRPPHVDAERINNELEWERFQESPYGADLIKGLMEAAVPADVRVRRLNGSPFISPFEKPKLIGVLEYSLGTAEHGEGIVWHRGIEDEGTTNGWWNEIMTVYKSDE